MQEARRSIREYGERPLTARQLGEFLYRVGRVADYWEDELHTPRGVGAPRRARLRPYPAGGGLYELDLYVLVTAVTASIADSTATTPSVTPCTCGPRRTPTSTRSSPTRASRPRSRAEQLQVLVIVAARFQRVAWKYASIAYSLILKDVGVLYDTMYLVATAMGLAPCAVGCGNADLFARAAGLDYYAQTSVGEFLLGSRDFAR